MTGERHGRLELAVGKVLQPFGHAGNAYVFLDEVVIRREIAVTEGPIFAVTILRGGFEIRLAETQAYASPNVGAATGHAKAAHPVERLVLGRGVRFLEVVDEPVVVVLAANVKFGLDRASLANNFRRQIAIFQFECRFVFGKVGVGLRAASLE